MSWYANSFVLLSLFIAGCGYSLRGTDGTASLPDQLNLDCSYGQFEQLCSGLQRELKLSGVELSQNASLTLSIKDQKFERRAVALQAGGSAAEFRLNLKVSFTIFDQTTKQEKDADLKTLEQGHHFLNDELNILGKSREEDDIKQKLSQRIARQIIQNLSGSINN